MSVHPAGAALAARGATTQRRQAGVHMGPWLPAAQGSSETAKARLQCRAFWKSLRTARWSAGGGVST